MLDRSAAAGLAALLITLAASPAAAFTFELFDVDFTLTPQFSDVRSFDFTLALDGPYVPGRVVDNAAVALVEYQVNGSLGMGTPSGFPGFALIRTAPSPGGAISNADWLMQDSFLFFEIDAGADLADGLQLSELVPDSEGVILTLDGREFERLDVARYHPPILVLRSDGTGLLQNSNNSSGSKGTTNPGSGLTVDVDYGEEYITVLSFVPSAVTVVPEPTAAHAASAGLASLYLLARRRARSPSRAGASRRFAASV